MDRVRFEPGRLALIVSLLISSALGAGCGEGDGAAPDGDGDADALEVVDTPAPDDVADTPSPPEDGVPANSPPVIEIEVPEDGTAFSWRERVVLRARVSDDATAPEELEVRWSSPIQGVFFEGSPRGDGVVEVTTSDLVLGEHLLILRAVDGDGAEAKAYLMIEVTPEEGAPRLSIAPLGPVTSEDLVARVEDYGLVGATGPLSVTWTWFRGAEPVSIDGDTVPATATAKGETWRVQAVVSDGVRTTPPGVAQVVVLNALPACPGGASIGLGSDGALSCVCEVREDLDAADPVADLCRWTADGVVVGAAGDCRIDAAGAAPGTVYGCTLAPFDGEEEGEPVEATPFVIADASGNSAPVPPGVGIDPRFGQPEHTYHCRVVVPSVDAQADPITYRVAWSVAGHLNPSGERWSVVPARDLVNGAGAPAAVGDGLACQVVASDGRAESRPGVSGEVILGTTGVSLGGGLGDVALSEPLGDGCWKGSDNALPECVPDVVCAVDIVACFNEDGSLRGPPTMEAVASLPGMGEVALTGGPTGDGGWRLSGEAPDLGPPTTSLPLTGLILTVESDGAGGTRTTLSGDLEIDGVSYAFEGAEVSTFVSGEGADLTSLKLEVPLPELVIRGTRFSGTLTLSGADKSLQFEGEVSFEGLDPLEVEGAFELDGTTVVAASLSAGGGAALGGVVFSGEMRLSLRDGVWALALSGGSLTLPGGVELTLSGAVEVAGGRLKEAVLDAAVVGGGDVVGFAGVAFEGGIEVRWSRERFALTLAGGALGPGGPELTVAGAVEIVDGVVVGGELSAGTDLVIAGVGFSGEAGVSFDEHTLTVSLAAGVVDLPEGGEVGLAGEIVLEDGALASASFEGAGAVALAGVRFRGAITAEWSGGGSWAIGLEDGKVALPGGQEVTLAGALAVVEGRVESGSFSAGAGVSFAGLSFEGAATASYRVTRDALGNSVGQTLSLGLSGGRIALEGLGELTLAGTVEIADGQVASASFSAGNDLKLGPIQFAGEASVSWSRADGLALELAGGEVSVAGAVLTVGGALKIEGGTLTCGELATASAASTTIGGVTFDVGIRYAAADRTCVWRDGTTTTSGESQFLASLSGGELTAGPVTVTLAGNATLSGGTLACAVLEAGAGATLPIGGVSFAIGARYAAMGQTCPWTGGASSAGELELTLNRGLVQVGDQVVSLSGAAVIAAGGVESATLTGAAALSLPGSTAAFTVGARYEAGTSTFELSLSGGEVEVAGASVALEGAAAIVAGQVACISFRSTGALAVIGEASFEVGGRFAMAGFQCAWMEAAAEAHTFEVTLAGEVVVGGAAFSFAGGGRVEGGSLRCAELRADGDVALAIGEARFDVGIRYAAAGATCAWADGTETSADAPTLLAALRDGRLSLGGAELTLSGTGELEGGELTCVELKAGGQARFEVAGVRFGAGARYAAEGATCAWMHGPAAADTLEATLHEGRVAVGGAELVLSGAAVVSGGAVRCADLTIAAGADLAFGGIQFSGAGRFIGAGATCDGVSAERDTLRLTLEEGAVEVAGTRVTLSGSGEVAGGAVQCIAFTAEGASPVLAGAEVVVSGFYAAAGVSCEGAPAVSEDTFALELALSVGPFAMSGLGRIAGGALACAELNASGGGTELAGVSFDVGGRFTAAGRTCTWHDGSETSAAEDYVFMATLKNGTLAVGGQTLSLAGEGEIVGGAITCASLEALGAVAIDVGGIDFSAGARYAAEGSTCGWSDGDRARLQLTLHDGRIAVGPTEVTLSGSAEIAGRKLACASFESQASAGVDLGGVSFAVGARYAAAGEACGWSDGQTERFELTLEDGALTIGANTFTLAGSARMEGGAIACAELESSGSIALGGTTFAVGARFVAANATCGWSDGTRSTASANTLSVYLSEGSVTVAGQTLGLSGLGVVRGGRLACASLEASARLEMDVAGVSFGMGGARFVAGGETCEWFDGTTTSASVDTFSLELRDGKLTVGPATLTLSGSAEITAGGVTCAALKAGGGARLDVGGVSFAAGARFAAAGHACGWSDGAASVLELTLEDGAVEAGGARLGLSGAAKIAGGKLSCADFDVTAGADVAFGGVSFDAGARFAAAGESCGWSDGAANTLELLLRDGAIDVGGASVRLSGGGVVSGGKLGCATLTSSAAGATPVGGLAFTVIGRFAAAGHSCAWTSGPARVSTFELALSDGRLSVGSANLALSGAGKVAGGRLTCAELAAAGGASAAVGGISFDLGARYAASGERCVWADGSETTATSSKLLLALNNGTLAVGGQRLTLSGTATLVGKTVACAELDAVGAASVSVGGLSFDAGARFAAAGHACAWTDGVVADNTLELTLRDGTVSAGGVTMSLSGAAEIAGGKVTCADLAVDSDAALAFGGVSFDARARFAAAGSSCGWSDASADRLELALGGASIAIGTTRVALTGAGEIVAGKVACVQFAAAGQASLPVSASPAVATLGGLTFDVGARFAAAGATCEWTDGAVAVNTFEVTLGGASVTVDGVGALTLSGAGRIEGGALTCAELGAVGKIDVGGVDFDLGARFVKAGATCVWADGTSTSATANTFTFALLNGSLAVGPATLKLSGAATLSGGALTCAELDAGGGAGLQVGGIAFAAGARFAAAGRTCAWRDGSATTATSSTLLLTLKEGKVAVGPAQVTLSGTGEIAANKLTCASFQVGAGAGLSLGGIAFEAGARYAAAGQTCGWSDGAANTLELTLGKGALDVGGVSVFLEGSATIAGGALTCAELRSASGATAGFGGVSFKLGGRYAKAGATCGGAAPPAVDTFVLTLDDGRLVLGPTTLDLAGTAEVAGGRLTCAELEAAGGASVALGGVSFDASVRLAMAGAHCEWKDGTTSAPTRNELLLGLQNGSLSVGGATLNLAGSGRIFGGQVACAELDAVGAAPISLAGVSFDAGARYAGTGHACTWADGTTRPAGPQTMQLTLRNGTLTVAGNTLQLSGSARVEGGQLTCAELTSAASIDLAGLTFATGARYTAAGASCTWLDGSSTTSATTRMDLTLSDGSLVLGGVDLRLSGSGTLIGGKLACVELASSGSAKASVGGVAFTVGARFAGAGQTCGWTDGAVAADTFEITLDNGKLAVDGVSIALSGTAEVVAGKLTCAALGSTAGATVAVGGVSFSAGARFTAAGATCPWSPDPAVPAAANRFELTLEDGRLTVGTTTLTLSGAASIVGAKLTCAELDAGGASALDLGGVSFRAGARYSAANETCVFSDGSVEPASPTAVLSLALSEGRISVGSNVFTMSGSGRIAGGQVHCAEVASAGDIAIAGVSFDAGARYSRAGATCQWRDGTETQATATTFIMTLREGRLQVGASNLSLSGEATLIGSKLACVELAAAGNVSVALDGVAFDLGARFAAAGSTCAWTGGPVAQDRFELTLANGQLTLGTSTVSLSGAATISGRKLTCAELAATGGATIDLAGATFDAGARFAAGGATCTWSDGTTSAPALDTLAVRLAGELAVAGQTMAVSGTGLLERGTVTCAELAASGGFSSLALGGVTFSTGARYSAAGKRCTWSDGTATQAPPTTYALQLALRDGTVTVADNTLTLSGLAELEGGTVTRAELAVGGDISLAGVTFSASAIYDAAAQTLVLTLHDGALTAGPVAIELAGSGVIDTATRSVTCLQLSAAGNARADLAGVTFDVGARYAAAGATCDWLAAPAPAATFEATLENGTLSLGDGATVTVSGTGTIVAGRVTCATFHSTGDLASGAGLGVDFDGTARYAAAGEGCGWRTPTPEAVLALDLSTTITLGDNVLTLVGAGTVGGSGVSCAELEVTGDVAIAGVTFVAGARMVAADTACAWADGTASAPGPQRLEVVLRDGRLALGDGALTLTGIAQAEKVASGYVVPCIGFDARSTGTWPIGGIAFSASAHFTAAGRQCAWDTEVAPSDTLRLSLEDGALAIGSVTAHLAGQALVTGGAVRCLELAADAAVSGFGEIAFDVGARFAAAGTTCTWADGQTRSYAVQTFTAHLDDGRVSIGGQTVTLSGLASVEAGVLTCAELQAGADVSVTLADATFDVEARYAAAGADCPWRTAPPPVDTFTLALAGALSVDGNTLALTGEGTLAGGAVQCATFTSNGDLPIGGLTFAAGARYAAAAADCGWNGDVPGQRLQVSLSDGRLALGGVSATLSGHADLVAGRLDCASLAVTGDVSAAFGGVAMAGQARYAAAGRTCTWPDATSTTGQSFTLALQGSADIGGTSIHLAGTGAIANGAVKCVTFDAGGQSAELDGLAVDVAATWAAANTACGDLAAAPTSAFKVEVSGDFSVGASHVHVSGLAALQGARLTCVDLAAQGNATIPLGDLDVTLGARFARAGATCTWPDQTTSSPLTDTLYASLAGALQIGPSRVALSGTGLIEAGRITCAELTADANAAVALANVAFDASARFSAATRACTWADGSASPAPAADTLRLALRNGRVQVGANTVTLAGQAELDRATGITCASFTVGGDIAIAGITFAGDAHFAAAGRSCGAWDATDAEVLQLVVRDGTLVIGANSVTASGSLTVVNRRVTSGQLVVDGALSLAGLSITSIPGRPAASLSYSAAYAASGQLATQSLQLTLDGQVAIAGLGAFSASGASTITNGRLDALTLQLGGDLTLASLRIAFQSLALVYKRQDPAFANTPTLELALGPSDVSIAGLGSLLVSGRTFLVNGALSELSLTVATNLSLAGLTLSGGASLVYTAATGALALTLTDARATVAGLGTLTLSGSSTLIGGSLESLTLTATGDLRVVNTQIHGAATLSYLRFDPKTGTSSLSIALTNASATITPLGTVTLAGAIALEGSSLASFSLAITSDVTLSGVRLSGGLALHYDAAVRMLSFSVTDAGATVAGLGTFGVSGSTVLINGALDSMSLAIHADLDLAGLRLAGDFALLYDGPTRTLRLSVANATASITGLDAAIAVSGSAQLTAGRLESLSLAVAGGASLQGLALSGTVTLDYRATYNAAGTLLTRALSLALTDAEVAFPGATATFAGRLDIENGKVACATLGPAALSLANITFAARADYIAAGKTCGLLQAPAAATTFTASAHAELTIAGNEVDLAGSASIVGGRVDSVAFSATVDLSAVVGLDHATVSAIYSGGTLCMAGDVQANLTLPLNAELRRFSASFCATGMSVASVDLDLHLIAPNLFGQPLELLASAGYDGAAAALSASICLAGEDPAGAVCCAGTTPSCAPAAWEPFNGGIVPSLPDDWGRLVVTALSGSVSISMRQLSIEALGAIDGSALPQLVPGLALDDLSVWFSASVGETSAAAAGVRGTFAVPLGEKPVDVTVSGTFQIGVGTGISLTLAGSIGDPESGVSADVEPLRLFIGEDTFEISYLSVELAASTSSGISITLAGGANITIPAPVSVGPIGLQVSGHGEIGKRTGFYLIGAICGISLPASILPPGFDAIPLGGPSPCETPTVAIALASRAYPAVELAPNTPIKRGLTLATTMQVPKGVLEPLGLGPSQASSSSALPSAPSLPSAPTLPTLPSIVAELGLDITGLRLKGALNIPWQVIRPDWNLPAVRLLQLNQLAFQVELSPSGPPTLSFTGNVLFEPAHCLPDYESFIEAGLASEDSPFVAFDPARITCLDMPPPFRDLPQQTPLTGSATFRYRPPKSFGGEIYLHGLWYEPFWVPNLAIASPGLTVAITLVDGPYGIQIPVPTSLGINGDVYWKRPYYDDVSADPVYPIACTTDADCTGYGNCSGGVCPAACVDGPDGDALPDTCRYTWPYTCAAPDPAAPDAACIDTLQQPADVPASLASTGVTLFYDMFPSPSAILVPLPTLIVRRELNNLNTLDIIPAIDELKDGARNLMRWAEERLPGVSPDLSPFPPCVDLDGDGHLDKSLSCFLPPVPLPNILQDVPVALALDKARIYFSTHERELFGVTFSPGIRADLDVKVTEVGAPTCSEIDPCENGLTCHVGTCKRQLFLQGALDYGGLHVEGRASPLSFLDAVTIKGDPFTKFADTHAGHVEVPTDPALETLPGTVETWLRPAAAPSSTWQSVLRHANATDGYEVFIGEPTFHCTPRYDDCSSGNCARVTCENPNQPTAPCGAGGVPGTCSLCPPDAAAPDAPCETPCTGDADCTAAEPTAVCVGAIPYNPDADTLATASTQPDFDMSALLASTAAACPQDANFQACVAAAIDATVGTLAGTALTDTCASCLAGFVTCEPRATVKVDVLRQGVVTRTVRTASPILQLDEWSHIAVGFDDASGEIALYVDGAVAETRDDSGRPACGNVCGCDAACTADPKALDCTGCSGERYPDLGHAAAVLALDADCAACESSLATWLTAMPAAGHWPAPGPGATLVMGAGVDAIDDVRIWSLPRTPDQINRERSAIPQDATPETLGDCSNAGPGTCAVGTKKCNADFDCPTGACVGAVQTGTCRADDDCSDDATCVGFVPATQRWAFSDALLARYEFDYDSYQSALGRAWNTRYHGHPDADADPDAIDCIDNPQLPPTEACGLIGAPCKDYERDASYKLHGRYVDAAWRTAIDTPGATGADDLFFRLHVPFSLEVLSAGGLGIRGGVALTFPNDLLPLPDLLTHGGARIDVNTVGTDKAEGELYARGFDLLGFGLCSASTTPCTTDAQCTDPVFGLDDIAYCRDDGFCTAGPCLARLTLSGYGPNGIDDGIDDGFYARTNLRASPFPTLQAGARVSVESFATPREDLAFASYDVGCPAGESCQTIGDYRFSLATGVELDLPLPFSLTPGGEPQKLLQICGNAVLFKPGKGDPTPDWIVAESELCPDDGRIPSFGAFVDGSISVLDQTLSGSALLTSCGFKIRSFLDVGKVDLGGGLTLPSLGTMSTDITGRFMPFRVCSEGYLNVDFGLPPHFPLKLIDLQAEVTADVCFGDASKYPGKDSGNFLRLLTGSPDGTPSDAVLRFLSSDSGASLFEMRGAVDFCIGNGDRVGEPGVEACSDDRLRLCGGLQLLDGIVDIPYQCLDILIPQLDVVFSLHESVAIDLGGVLPASQSEVFIEMCPSGQRATWNSTLSKVTCVADANPGYKMTAPHVMLRFRSSLTFLGRNFGDLDFRLTTQWVDNGLRFTGFAAYDDASEVSGEDMSAFTPTSCQFEVSVHWPIGAVPSLEIGTFSCPGYCIGDVHCAAGEYCAFGQCQVCGDGRCNFGENSIFCPQDCGYPVGSLCDPDVEGYCASDICWSLGAQIAALINLEIIPKDPGVCLPCLPGLTDCPAGQYCDGFQFFECRDKAPYGTDCAMNEACQSGRCQWDALWNTLAVIPRCAECTDDSHCGAGQWCDTYPSLLPTPPTYKCYDPAPTGGKCGVGPYIGATDDNCQAGNFCDVDGTCHVKAGNDVLCTGDRVCASSHCCLVGPLIWTCEQCCAKADCDPGYGCYGNTCRKGNDGELCVEDAECNSNLCVLGVCTSPAGDGAVCFDHRACTSGVCAGLNETGISGICTTPVPNDYACLANSACQSGQCCYFGVTGICKQCCSDSVCGPDYACHDYTCQKGREGWHCVTTQDCQAGLVCNSEFFGNFCRNP